MIVDIEVYNDVCKILTKLPQDKDIALQDECSFEVEGSEYKAKMLAIKTHGHAKWDGHRRLYNRTTHKFPIGLLDRVRDKLMDFGYTVHTINKRKEPVKEYGEFKFNQNIHMRYYQEEAVIKSIFAGNGIVKIATGGGKTMVAAATIAQLGKNSIFIVHTRDLLYQTINAFKNAFPDEEIGQIGDGVLCCQRITVATMQTLAILGDIELGKNKYDEEDNGDTEKPFTLTVDKKQLFKAYAETVGVVMMDEVQIVSSQMAFGVRFLFPCANYAFGYSASPWRDDGSDMMIEAAFGTRIVDINATTLIREGYLVKPTIIINQTSKVSNPGKTYAEIYKNCIVENESRNQQIVDDAIKQYDAGRNTLILITQIKHGETLTKMLNDRGYPAKFISGKSRTKVRQQVIDDMRNGKAGLVVASTIADVGLDVPRLQSIIEAGAGKSSVTALQRLGRIMRVFEGKDKCYFITYRDTAKYLRDQITAKIAIWRTEPGFEICDTLFSNIQ